MRSFLTVNQKPNDTADPRLGTRNGLASPRVQRRQQLRLNSQAIREPRPTRIQQLVPTAPLRGKHRLCPFQTGLTNNLGDVVIPHHVPILAIDQIFFLFD
jgi:hypothetical protein